MKTTRETEHEEQNREIEHEKQNRHMKRERQNIEIKQQKQNTQLNQEIENKENYLLELKHEHLGRETNSQKANFNFGGVRVQNCSLSREHFTKTPNKREKRQNKQTAINICRKYHRKFEKFKNSNNYTVHY